MHNDGNVVPLRKVTIDQATYAPPARLPVILLQVRDKATQQLRQGLQALFDNADDTLFEMADRAGTDVEHNVFFQAMRDLRLKRKSIERVFFEQFFEAFVSLTQYSATHTVLPQPLPFDTRKVLPDDELERTVAVEAMVNKVLSRDGFALDQLTARLSTLLGRSLMEQHNPMGPTLLCAFFLQAGRELGVEIKVKLIILKLFERYVLGDVFRLYSDANQLLIATGVLSGLTSAPMRQIADDAAVVPSQAQRHAQVPAVDVADEDVINLIAMLFDYFLDDRTLPDSFKPLIGQLQIPLVKVAMLDKSFFSRSSHPARRLLNEIANATLGWSQGDDPQRDSLYLCVEQLMQRLSSDFVDDPAIFSESLANFLAFTSDERRRCELLEQRIRDAEEGRARTVLARQRVEQALNQALLGKVLPQGVVLFVQQAWSQVLLLVWLKHGDQSTQWHAAVQTMEQLVWSVQRHDEPEARPHLLALLPGLLKALREGLSGSACDPFATAGFFSELAGLHVQLFEHRDPATPIAGAPVMIEVLEEFVLPSADEGRAGAISARLPPNDAGLLQVEQLRIGHWVEFQQDTKKPLRCKLAAINEACDQYIFVNRTGMKVMERSGTNLALEFRHDAVHVLDSSLLMDRALEFATGNLQRLNLGK
ncbi:MULTISPECIES: DUF1631 domain-containing protein [unclassified Pseudomonas]|uniref:DUF1631 domain-containing protein n=1 Tax=Pseudomonas sp. MYb327 TaxID=2745230 RepID=A0AAU8DXV5_9PSED